MSSSESMRWWLITSTTYGSWLPGDRRGFVSTVTDEAGNRVRHNLPGTPYDADMPLLEKASRQLLKCPPIRLRLEQAEALRDQFFETAKVRGWRLLAIAIMSNHFHVVIGAGDATEPEKVFGDLKSYGSRALNNRWGKPASGTWWTTSGSKRRLKVEAAVVAAVRYVENQQFPLVIWIDPEFRRSSQSG
jgi:REP element-mobilizing transposase RayT